MSNLELKNVSDFDFSKIEESFSKYNKKILFVFSCGYESRSLSQFLFLKKHVKNHEINYLCFSFSSYKNSASRSVNDSVLAENNVEPIEVESKDWEGAWRHLSGYVSNNLNGDAQIYIDYSSMPRNWYCMLANKLVLGELGKTAALIYSHGRYSDTQYPWVGYGEFNKFSGRPDITTTSEVNIFGLGFDSVRTHGIWTYLDPQMTISVIARSPNNGAHCQRVEKENPEIISASTGIYEVEIDKFGSMLATLIDLSRKHQVFGDIALVPDGPKPMVIAMSLVPNYLDEKGFYCWNVGHVKPDDYEPIDVEFSGEYFGFGVF